MSSASAALEIEGLRRDYGERIALREVTLALRAGGTLAVLGPNGSGKTTLLRVLATLLRPSAGGVRVLDCELPDEAWRLRGRIGYVGHEPLLYRELTVRENLLFWARLHGLRSQHAERRVSSLLERVAMERRADERVRLLSAGMAQRIAICRAVLHDPELLLLDEPLSHLDPEGAALVEPLIGTSSDRTRVLVTHDVGAGVPQGAHVLALGHGGVMAYEGPAAGFEPEKLGVYEGAPR